MLRTETLIKLESVDITYPAGNRHALKGIDLEIKSGEFIAIMGKTGSGKSTLLRLMNGSIPHAIDADVKGNVIVFGEDTRTKKIYELTQYVGEVFDLPDMQHIATTVYEDVLMGPIFLDLPKEEIFSRGKNALESTRLAGFEDRLVYTLSGGEKQSLAIAGVLALLPEVLIGDEPTSMLDPLGTERVWSVLSDLHKNGKTIVLATQKSELVVSNATRVIFLDRGRILFDGPTKKAFEQDEVIEKCGVRVPGALKLSNALGTEPRFFTFEEACKGLRGIFKDKKKAYFAHRHPTREMKKGLVGKPLMVVENVHHVFKGGIHALQGVSFAANPGEFIALIGQNGSGKTTLAKHLVGLQKPTNKDSKIVLGGTDIIKSRTCDIFDQVTYVFQNPDLQLFSETVFDETAYSLRNLGWNEKDVEMRTMKWLRLLGLEKVKDEPPQLLARGQRTRVAIASSISVEPKVLIVDEPTNGQDYLESRYIMRILKETTKDLNMTVIIITHDMDLVANYAERVLVLCQGKILLDGSPREVFSRPEVLKETWIEPPVVTRIGQELHNELGFPNDLLSVKELKIPIGGD